MCCVNQQAVHHSTVIRRSSALNRGDRTAVELFASGIRCWKHEAQIMLPQCKHAGSSVNRMRTGMSTKGDCELHRYADTIKHVLKDWPLAGLAVEPTPIYRLARLSSKLGREVFALREDMTGFGLGGNKVRKLDYLIGDALSKGTEVLITTSASSFSRNAAVAAKACGLELHVLLNGEPAEHNSLSRSFFEQFETKLHYVASNTPEGLARAQEELAANLHSSGRIVYEMPPGGSTEIGTLGYVHVFEQIARYTESTSTHFDNIVLATGSAGTQAGLAIGQCISGYPTRVIGIAISRPTEVQHKRVLQVALSTADSLGVPFDESTVLIDDRFLGEGYPIPSQESIEGVRLFAHTEGMLLDPVYGGKAAAWLIHAARVGELKENENTLFIHTGGNGGLFY